MAIPATLADALNRQCEWEHRDSFPPGPQLAVALSGIPSMAASNADDDLADAELIQAARGARRLMSWAASRQLAMLAALAERRRAEAASWPQPTGYRTLNVEESLIEEISLGLCVTSHAAAVLLKMAERLAADLPRMRALLETGRISLDHVRILCDALTGLPVALIPLLEAAVAPDAPDMTTGQFRTRIKAVLQALDPEGFAERSRTTSQRHRRLEQWDNGNGTADLALCDLPAEQTSAIYNKITAVAQAMRTDGDTRTLDHLRADLAAALLQGTTLPDAARTLLLAATAEDGPSGQNAESATTPDRTRAPATRPASCSTEHMGDPTTAEASSPASAPSTTDAATPTGAANMPSAASPSNRPDVHDADHPNHAPRGSAVAASAPDPPAPDRISDAATPASASSPATGPSATCTATSASATGATAGPGPPRAVRLSAARCGNASTAETADPVSAASPTSPVGADSGSDARQPDRPSDAAHGAAAGRPNAAVPAGATNLASAPDPHAPEHVSDATTPAGANSPATAPVAACADTPASATRVTSEPVFPGESA